MYKDSCFKHLNCYIIDNNFYIINWFFKGCEIIQKAEDKRHIRVINKKHIAQNRLKKALPYFFLMPYITTNDFVLKYNFYSIINKKR